MTQLFGAIGTLILSLFYDNPADAPLSAIVATLLCMTVLGILIGIGLFKLKQKIDS